MAAARREGRPGRALLGVAEAGPGDRVHVRAVAVTEAASRPHADLGGHERVVVLVVVREDGDVRHLALVAGTGMGDVVQQDASWHGLDLLDTDGRGDRLAGAEPDGGEAHASDRVRVHGSLQRRALVPDQLAHLSSHVRAHGRIRVVRTSPPGGAEGCAKYSGICDR